MILLIITSTTFLGAIVLLAMLKPKKLHVRVEPMKMKVMGINIMPIIITVYNLMPAWMRKKSITKKNAPNPNKVTKDLYDLNGSSPYKTTKIVTGKLWEIIYSFENSGRIDTDKKKEVRALTGMDPNSEDYRRKLLAGAASHGEEAVELAKKDLEIAKEWNKKETFTDDEMLEIYSRQLKSFIVKLNNGNLMLYAPIRIRDEVGFGTWIETLGKVEWIVVASSYHTLSLPNVIKRFPDAKIIGTSASEAKLNFINALPRKKYDVNCQNTDQLSALNSQLKNEGVQLFYINGDVGTNAIVVVAHEVALECDLIYSHHDGGFVYIDKEDVNNPENWELRIFRNMIVSKPYSPNGMLATYRFQMMDPTDLGAMSYDQPARNGSSCTTMAESLRTMLKADFKFANGVHYKLSGADHFRKSIDANWKWLDGKSLLPN